MKTVATPHDNCTEPVVKGEKIGEKYNARMSNEKKNSRSQKLNCDIHLYIVKIIVR